MKNKRKIFTIFTIMLVVLISNLLREMIFAADGTPGRLTLDAKGETWITRDELYGGYDNLYCGEKSDGTGNIKPMYQPGGAQYRRSGTATIKGD